MLNVLPSSRLVNVVALASAVLLAASIQCFARESIEIVSKDRAKALGLEIRTNAAGPDAVRVELEFETKGQLKNYSRVALEMHDGWKFLLSSTLQDQQSKPGRVIVSCTADRINLDKVTMKVVVQHGPRARNGHVIRVKDFVDLEKLR